MNNSKTHLVLVLLISFVGFFAAAVEPSVRFNQLTVEDGLSQNSIKSITQDHKGFLWFGTNDGLNRYDGYQFKHFRNDPDDDSTISSNHISVIFADSKGMLWIGTANSGLDRYDRKSQRFIHYKQDDANSSSLSHNYVTGIIEDINGNLWISTMNGLNKYDPQSEQFIRYKHLPSNPQSLPDNRVHAMFADTDGTLWVGTQSGGLSQFNPGTQQFQHLQHQVDNPNSLSHNFVKAIAKDDKGNIWAGTDGGGLNIFNQKTRKFKRLIHESDNPHSLTNDHIWTLFKDRQGVVWVGTDGGGLDHYDSQRDRFIHYKHRPSVPHSLSHNDIRSLFQDSEGLLWIGTFSGGVNRIDTKQKLFGHYKHYAFDPKSLTHNTVFSIFKDEEQNLWVGTLGGGVNKKQADGDDFIHFKHDPKDPTSLSSNSVWDISADAQNRLWIGTQNGLNLFDKETETFTRYYHEPNNPNSLSHNWISDIKKDNQGNLWISTRGGGLNKYDPRTNQFKHFRHNPSDPDSLSNDIILSIYSDSDGFLWLATWTGGLERFDPYDEKFIHHRHDENNPNSLSNDTVISIIEDSKGHIWATTLGGGLNKYNHKTDTFTHYREKDGLANDTIYGIIEDNQQNLWLSTNLGLSRFNPELGKFKNYSVEDGLQSNEFNGNAAYKSDSGELFFGGINGFNRFYPETIKENKRPPVLVFTDFLLFNKSVAIQTAPQADQQVFTLPIDINELEELTLSYKQSLISFEFAALNYHNPRKNQYSYKLEGVDKDWITSSANIRRATYTNLPSGVHTLKVKASNANGYWNEEGISIVINVLPPPWRSWWAYTLYFLVITSIISLFVYQQIKKRQVINEHNKQLRFALWGSGDELWDINLVDNTIISQNRLEILATCEEAVRETKGIGINKVHDDDKATVKEAIRRHIEGEVDYYESTYRAQTTNGNWIWLMDRGKINEWDDDKNATRICGTTKNIHQLKTTEEELRLLTVELEQRVERRTYELRQSNDHLKNTQEQLIESEKMAALGNLVVGISHEINTPVGIAITAVSTLKDHVATLYEKLTTNKLRKQDLVSFKDSSQQGIALALSNMYRTSRLVEYFKQIAVNQSGEQISKIKLLPLLENTVEASILQDRPNSQGSVIECPEHLQIKTYVGALTQIVSQLVQNTVNHGYTMTEALDIKLKVTVNDEGITILYKDKGKGMDEQTQKQVFDPFYTTNRGANIGLGMHVTYNQICHLLRGSIKCESAPEEGCTYTIFLPCEYRNKEPESANESKEKVEKQVTD